MFTVKGPTTRVVVVGAGLGGLSAAMRLAGAGREVVLLEREQVPGGRVGRLQIGGYSFDTGATVLTMPDLIDDAFASLGEDYRDWLDLIPLDPAYRAFYPDGSSSDVFSDPERMAVEIEARDRVRRGSWLPRGSLTTWPPCTPSRSATSWIATSTARLTC